MNKTNVLEKYHMETIDMVELTEVLENKGTVAAFTVTDKIKGDSAYKVYDTMEEFTIVSSNHVTKKEIKQLSTLLNRKYVPVATYLDRYDAWNEYREARADLT